MYTLRTLKLLTENNSFERVKIFLYVKPFNYFSLQCEMCLNLFHISVAFSYRSIDKMYWWKIVSVKCFISKGYIPQFGNQGDTHVAVKKSENPSSLGVQLGSLIPKLAYWREMFPRQRIFFIYFFFLMKEWASKVELLEVALVKAPVSDEVRI